MNIILLVGVCVAPIEAIIVWFQHIGVEDKNECYQRPSGHGVAVRLWLPIVGVSFIFGD